VLRCTPARRPRDTLEYIPYGLFLVFRDASSQMQTLGTLRPGLGAALPNDAAGDAGAAAAERLGLVAVVVAAGMDHQRVALEPVELGDPERRALTPSPPSLP
jgi:hypothetical protein